MGMRGEVRKATDQANEEAFGEEANHIFITVAEKTDSQAPDEALQTVET